MCLIQKRKCLLSLLLCSILLVLSPCGQLSLGLHAEEVTEPSSDEAEKNWQYWNSGYSLVKDNTQGFLTRRFGFISDDSAGAEIYAHAMETLNDSWDALTTEEKERYDNDFRYYVGYQILGNRKGESVTPTEIDVQPEAQNAFQSAINVYVENNPLGYVQATISTYNNLSVSQFSNYGTYKSAQEFMKHHSYTICGAPNTWGDGRWAYMVGIDADKFDISFIGTVTSGIFTNVYFAHNWASYNGVNIPENTEGISYTCFKIPAGSFGTGTTMNQANSSAGIGGTTWRPTGGNLKNITSWGSGTSQQTIFSGLEKDETVFVFTTMNSYKNYNAGKPQAYYQAPSSMIDSNNTVSSITGSNNSYQYITNNIKSGMTGQEVIDLVALVMQKGSGSGSGSDDDDNPFSFLGDIGDLIKDLVTGVGDLLTDLVGSLVDVVLGEKQEDGTRTGGIIGLITDILSSLTGLINTNIGDFLSAVFGWLPTEFVTIFKAMLIFGIFFSIWKMIRG